MIAVGYIVMCLVFGTTFLAIKIGVEAGLPPFLSAGLRFLVAGILMYTWMKLRGKAQWSLLLRKEMLLTGLGLTFGTFAALYWAEQYVSSGIGAILSATGPLMIMMIQTLLLRQPMSVRMLAGCVTGFAGVVLVMLPGLSIAGGGLWMWGCIVILVGELCYAAGALYSKRVIVQFQESHPVALNAVQMMYGGLLLGILSCFTEAWDYTAITISPAVWSLVYLTVIGSMVGHSLFYWLVARTNPLFPATWLYISPPIAVGLGVVFYGEHVTWMTWVGVVLIVSGLLTMNEGIMRWIRARMGRMAPTPKQLS